MPTFGIQDIRFLLSRVRGEWLPEEQGGLAPLGPTGARDVQGVGNNNTDITKPGYWFGAADTLFLRLTSNRLTNPTKKNDVISSPFANSERGPTKIVTLDDTTTINGKIADALNPRNISNLIADSDVVHNIGFNKTNPGFKLLDDPTGRISPTSGAINPLPYSNWMSQFGQFFDHGLDFVSKGVDGMVAVNLLPSDSKFAAAAAAGGAMYASRSNTVNVTIGEGSTDALLAKMGLLLQQGVPTWNITSTLTDVSLPGVSDPGGTVFKYYGTLVLNNTLIKIAANSEVDLANQINLYTPTTGVTATLSPFPTIPGVVAAGTYQLQLAPAVAESFNQTSPFIDLSQNYGSDGSRTVFLREYLDETTWATGVNAGKQATVVDLTTGRLLNAGATVNGIDGAAGMANWAQVKANALKLGLVLHDADISAIPLIAFDDAGHMILGDDGMPQFVALNKVTGAVVYVKDTTVTSDLVLMTTKHAFLNDMGVRLPALTETTRWLDRDLIDITINNVNMKTALEAHYIAGDGRLNENIGLTAVHEVFLNEHNRVFDLIMQKYGFYGTQPRDGWDWTDPLTGAVTKVTGEEIFQQAKLVLEMEYQHMVFAEFARKLSPNIAAFAAVNPAINAGITSEFANAVYRLGHSMLPETVGMRQYVDSASFSTANGSNVVKITMANHGLKDGTSVTLTGVDASIGGLETSVFNDRTFTVTWIDNNSFSINVGSNATSDVAAAPTGDKIQIDINKGLIEAFLNPQSFTPGATGAWLGAGSSAQVGMRIDEKVTDALRDNLLGQPLDLATLNLVRGRDAGIPTLNEMRSALQAIAPVLLQPTLNPYTSWKSFQLNLKGSPDDQIVTVKNFMMAYASDALLVKFNAVAAEAAGVTPPSVGSELTFWYDLRDDAVDTLNPAKYLAALQAAANAAYNDPTFMTAGANGNKDFNNIDAWIGGLAEKEVVGGMLGATFDAVFSMQLANLQNGDLFYYLGRVPGAEFFNESIDGSLLSDLVSRSSGAKYLYGDIFSVADKTVMMDDLAVSGAGNGFATFDDLQGATTTVSGFDAAGVPIQVEVGRAGYVGNIFYGNPGDYLDARGVKSPNGIGNASETIVGTANADNIQSLGGNDTVWGEGGGDNIQGGAGVDFLHGGDGNDTIDGGADNDFIYGEAGNDTLRGNIGIDTMFGGDGNDTMYGGEEGDLMIGGTGNDVMYGGDGVVTGGVSDQVLIGGVLTNIFIRGLIDPETVVSVALIDDAMFGGQGDDVMYGGGGWDNLTGESGHDVLVPGTGGAAQGGREVMNGGEGDDIYIVESDVDFAFMDINDTGLTQLQRGTNIDTYRQGRGIGVDEVRFTQNVAGTIILGQTNNLGVASIFTGIERVVLDDGTQNTGTAAIDIDALLAVPGLNVGLEIVGNAGVNNIIGTIFDDVINGGVGADIMDGGNGNDTYIVDNAGDVITEVAGGGGGTDTVRVQANINYTLANNLENLTLLGTNAGQSGTGNSLANVIIGSAVRNTISGGAGADTLYGGGGDDNMSGNGGNDVMYGELNLDPSDPLYASVTGNDTMSGGNGNDLMFGENGDDTLNGDAGSDTIDGGAGNDRINGGSNVDTLTGGLGADLFVFSSAADIGVSSDVTLLETITDFVSGTDKLDLRSVDANSGIVGTQAFNFINGNSFSNSAGELRYASDTGVLEGDTDGDGTADFRMRVLNGQVALPVLAASDFIQPISVSLSGQGAVAEGSLGKTSTQTFTVTLSSAVVANTTFSWAVTGTGIDPANAVDFGGALPSGTVVVAAGTNTATFTVVVSGDITVEQDETFQVTISNPTQGAQAIDTFVNGTASVTSTIVNDDLFNVINGGVLTGDTINGTSDSDLISGLGGNDTLSGAPGNDVLYGGDGDDILNGNGGMDVLEGGAGVDVLNGGNGDDYLIGSSGRDTFNGGAGADTFKFNAAIAEIGSVPLGTNDIIQAFVSGEDIIDLSLIDANTNQGGNQAFVYIGTAAFTALGQLRYENGELQGNVAGTTTADFRIVFTDGVPASLQQTDFIL